MQKNHIEDAQIVDERPIWQQPIFHIVMFILCLVVGIYALIPSRESTDYESARKSKTFLSVNYYLDNYPNGKHRAVVDSLYNMLWHEIDETYESKRIDSKAKVFFRAVLDNAQKNRDFRIGITFKAELALKDWKDYPLEVRKAITEGYKQELDENNRLLPPPSSSNIPSIKNVFTQKNQRDMEELVVKKLSEQLQDFFGKELFVLKIIDSTKGVDASLPTYINLSYDVKSSSQSIGSIEIPSIYTWMKGEVKTNKKEFQGYLLGVGINWTMVMETANQTEKFILEHDSEANESYRQQGSGMNMENIYNDMVRDNFTNFAFYIGKNFGWTTQEKKITDKLRQNQ
jgi:hypothetical protein